MTCSTLLDVRNLSVALASGVQLVEDVSFSVNRGETVALVGESGCGKSLTALSLLGLMPPGLTASGRILLEGEDLNQLAAEQLRKRRGSRAAMVFQDPLTSLNPVLRIGDQIVEAIQLDGKTGRAEARHKAVELLSMVRIPDPAQKFHAFPHQLSGGMRQRVLIALALSQEPKLLVADEPTTALDVTVQAQILDLLKDIQNRTGLGLVLITHDLAVVRRVADRVVVMYSGAVIEEGPVNAVLSSPLHPYTSGLLAARPHGSHISGTRLEEIPGTVPAPSARPVGCVFGPRCLRRRQDCETARPKLTEMFPHRKHSCFHPMEMQS
jgi:peptide/nickel transport system ATP-binding protein